MYCGAGRWLGVGWARRARVERAGGALGMQAGTLGAGAAGARMAGSGLRGARGVRSRGAAGARPGSWARGLGAGRAAWAGGLALGSALDPFSIRFDSFFFPESLNEHCSL